MAWRRPGDKPLSGPMMVSLLTHICVTRPQWVNVGNEPIVSSASEMTFMMTSPNENIFRVTGPLCRELTGHRWIPPHKGQWRGALMFYLICAWTNAWGCSCSSTDRRFLHNGHFWKKFLTKNDNIASLVMFDFCRFSLFSWRAHFFHFP